VAVQDHAWLGHWIKSAIDRSVEYAVDRSRRYAGLLLDGMIRGANAFQGQDLCTRCEVIKRHDSDATCDCLRDPPGSTSDNDGKHTVKCI